METGEKGNCSLEGRKKKKEEESLWNLYIRPVPIIQNGKAEEQDAL